MQYIERRPSCLLSGCIECFWSLSGPAQTQSVFGPGDRILPDGCIELIFHLQDRYEEIRDGRAQIQPKSFVVGQMERPLWIRPRGKVLVVGVRFHPWGAAPFLGLPMSELTGRMIEMGGIQKRLRTTLEIAMERTSDPHALLAAAEHESLQWPRQPKFEDTTVTLAGQEIVRRGGVVSVSTLARDAGISLRHFERRFHRIVGLSPKRLSNVLRFQQVFQTVEAGNQTNWTEVALHCGYFDQAHLNRDFRRFAASTPPQIFSCRDSLTHQFTRKNRVSNFSKTK